MKELKCIHEYIFDINGVDNPSAFYMNPLADLNCRIIEVQNMIDTIMNVQPKEGGGGGGQSKESVVEGLIVQYKSKYDNLGFDIDAVERNLFSKGGMFIEKDVSKTMGDGLTFPLNVFFKFEIMRYQNIVSIMKSTLDDIRSAIKGEIIMSAELSEAINAIFNNRIPKSWLYNAASEEISWLSDSISSWFKQ